MNNETTPDRLDRNHPHLQHGAGATYLAGSDRYPYEVITANFFGNGKKKGLVKSVIVRRLRSISTQGCVLFTESQAYRFESQPGRPTEEFRAMYANGSDKTDGFCRLRQGRSSGDVDLVLGDAQAYRDPSF
jgi:hypothetical protein